MKINKAVVLDGDAVLRVAKKLQDALRGENLPVVMQAFGLLLTKGGEEFKHENNLDAQIVDLDEKAS